MKTPKNHTAARTVLTRPAESDQPALPAAADIDQVAEAAGLASQALPDGPSALSLSPPSAPQPLRRPRAPRYEGTPELALARAAIEAATTPAARRRLKSERGLAAVIYAPDASWVEPLKDYLKRVLRADFWILGRTGSSRTVDNPGSGNDDVAAKLAAGVTVIGISPSGTVYLPRALTSAADLKIVVGSPNGHVIGRMLRWCLRGRIPAEIDGVVTAGLDFDDIVAAVRAGSTPKRALERLAAAMRSRTAVGDSTSLPTIEEAASGPARDWALELKSDIAKARATGDFSGITKGCVLYGPPGTGKSFLVKVVAAGCGLPLVATSVAEFFASSAGFLDSVVKAQRDVFARAAALAPCVLFLDELDAMPNRATLSPRGKDWWTPVITDLLLLTDSAVSSRSRIIVVGATNRIQDVDEALLRPGRLERAIEVPPPDADGLARMMRHHLAGDLADFDLVPLARLGAGASAADATEWVRTARRRARLDERPLRPADLENAIAPAEMRNPITLRRSTIHEAGHAVCLVVQGADGAGLTHVSMIERGESGGHTRVKNNTMFLTARQLDNRIVGLLAARAAEIVILGSPASSAYGDLLMATRLATSKHTTYGLGSTLVFRASAEEADKALLYDADLRAVVEKDLQRLHKVAEDLIAAHRDAVEAVADALARSRFLTAEETAEIVRRYPPCTTAEGDHQ